MTMKSLGGGLYIRSGKTCDSYVHRFRRDGCDVWKTIGDVLAISEETARKRMEYPEADDEARLCMFSVEKACPIKFVTKCLTMTEEEVSAAAAPRPQTGVYFLLMNRKVIYVGQSTDIMVRIGQHARSINFDSFTVLLCGENELDSLESHYIRKLNPPLNGRTSNGKVACSTKSVSYMGAA